MAESYLQTVAPAIEPVSLDDALRHCRIVETDDYTYVSDLISRARRYVERRLERQFITATWKLTLDTFPGYYGYGQFSNGLIAEGAFGSQSEIILAKLPVLAVSKLEYLDTSGVLQTLSATNYQVSIRGPDSPGRITPAYSYFWPYTQPATYDTVRVTFTAGYGATAASVPETIRQAILLLISHWFENRDSVNIGNTVNETPLAFESLLAAESWGAYS